MLSDHERLQERRGMSNVDCAEKVLPHAAGTEPGPPKLRGNALFRTGGMTSVSSADFFSANVKI